MKHARTHILHTTLKMAMATGLSRIFGFIRELCMVRYFGVGPAADAFLTALRLPYSLRKIFAEGALTAALVPSLVTIIEKQGMAAAARVITVIIGTMIFVVSSVVCLIIWAAPTVIHYLVPGWTDPVQIATTAYLLRMLIPTLVWFSLMAVFAGALNAAGQFGMASLSQVIQNLLMIITLICAIIYQFSVETVALWTVLGILLLVLFHAVSYSRHYKRADILSVPTADTVDDAFRIAKKFFPCIITLGALELNIFIDQIFASYLPSGSVSLLYYTQAFVRLPLGIVIASFATVLLPTLSRVVVRTPRRLSFHLYEALKLVFWVTIPSVFAMIILGYPAFSTLMHSEHFSLEQAAQAARLLALFACGIPFFAANRVIIAMYHAGHDTLLPTVITLATTMINTIGNSILIKPFGIYGLVGATIVAEILKSIILLATACRIYGVRIPIKKLSIFIARLFIICVAIATVMLGIGTSLYAYLALRAIPFLTIRWGLWIWAAPLCAMSGLIYYLVRKSVGCACYFLGD